MYIVPMETTLKDTIEIENEDSKENPFLVSSWSLLMYLGTNNNIIVTIFKTVKMAKNVWFITGDLLPILSHLSCEIFEM